MSGRDTWCTPPSIVLSVRRIARIALDPCTNVRNPVGADNAWTRLGLDRSWHHARQLQTDGGQGLAYVNPPFTHGKIQRWVAKVLAEAERGTQIVILTPRDATRWFRELRQAADAAATPWARVNYVHPRTGKIVHGVRFASSLHYFGPRPDAFCAAFEAMADVRVLRRRHQAAAAG